METQKAGIPPFYVCFDLRSDAWRVGMKTTMVLFWHDLTNKLRISMTMPENFIENFM